MDLRVSVLNPWVVALLFAPVVKLGGRGTPVPRPERSPRGARSRHQSSGRLKVKR